MKKNQHLIDDEAGAFDSVPTDTERLNKLQSLTEGYMDGWILRESTTGRGMRLHEHDGEGTYEDVRLAIDAYHPPGSGLHFTEPPVEAMDGNKTPNVEGDPSILFKAPAGFELKFHSFGGAERGKGVVLLHKDDYGVIKKGLKS